MAFGRGLCQLAILVFLLIHSGVCTNDNSKELDYDYEQIANASFTAFLDNFWDPSVNYLRDFVPAGPSTQFWNFAQGFDTLTDACKLFRDNDYYRSLISDFYTGQGTYGGGWLDDYYDDENWMTLALIRSFEVTNETRYLQTAMGLFSDIMNAWDTTCCGDQPGGIWWNKAHTQKATASNAGPVITAALLHRYYEGKSLLDWAVKVYDFWFANMVNHTTWQVCDHMIPNGDKLWWKFSYNEGLMIGASVALYEATGNKTYLANAQNFASFMLTNEVTSSPLGNVLFDGSSCNGDCMEFKGPAYRYLVQLFVHAPSNSLYKFLKQNVDAIWSLARNPANNLVGINWAGPIPPTPSQSTPVYQAQQNAATMSLLLFARSVLGVKN